MHCSNNARTTRRSFSIDQIPINTRLGLQSQSHVEHICRGPTQNGIFRVPSNHAISRTAVDPPSKGAASTFPENENRFREMSRTELEIFTQTKIFEANRYKYHFKESERKCNVLQKSLNEVKILYAATYKEHADLKEHCDRFVVQVHRVTAENAPVFGVANFAASAHSR